MVTKGKKAAARGAALLLALLLLLPAPAAWASEPTLSEAESAVQAEESSQEESSQPESAPESSDSASSSVSQEEDPLEESSLESQGEETVSSQGPSSEEPQEEEPPLQETEEESFASYPLLVTGGHDAYMHGESGARFYPERAMTRAEMATVLYNLLAEKPPVSQSNFTDVSSGDWFYTAVNSLANAGILDGYADGSFKPTKPVTRAEFVQALSRCFPLSTGDVPFTDVDTGHWAYQAIGSAVAKGWIDGYGDGTFRPNDNILRCQVPKILNIALDRKGDGYASDRYTQEFVDVPTTHWAFLDIAEAADPVAGSTTGRVTGNLVRVRSGPGTNYQILGLVNSGDLVTVLSQPSGGWVQIRTAGGITGYMSSQYVEIDSSETPDPDPDPDPDPGPGDFEVGQTVRVTATSGLNLRSGPETTYNIVTTLATGALLTVTSVESNGWLGVRTNGGVTGFVSGEFVEVYQNSGEPASGATLSATSLTIRQYQSVRLDGSVESNISSMRWQSSNSSVVSTGYSVSYGGNSQGAMLYGVSPGTATITFTDGAGATATCKVTVTAAQPVRFAYADNIVTVNANFTLTAVTDTSRAAVRFEIERGPASGAYETTSYTPESRVSSYGLPTNTVRVFTRQVSFGAPGEYTIRAYSRNSSGDWSTEYYEFSVLVISGSIYSTETTNESRRVSTRGLELIANYEGGVPEIADDVLVSGNPTVGYGYVVPVNTAFYNNLTPSELFAQLVEIANETYSPAVERFRSNNGIRMNQAQFDALTSFVFNCGTGTLTTNYGFCRALLNGVNPTGISSSNQVTGTLNVSDASVYAGTSVTSQVVTNLSQGSTVTVFGYERHRSETQQEVWYHVSLSNGQVGWIPAGYVQLSGSYTLDLAWTDSTVLANNFLQWNSAGGVVYPGLVWRRLAECKLFFFADYEEANPGSSEYRYNNYGFIFPSNAAQYDYRH